MKMSDIRGLLFAWLCHLLRANFGAATGGMFSFFFFLFLAGPESRRDAEEGDGRAGRHSAPRLWTAPTALFSRFSFFGGYLLESLSILRCFYCHVSKKKKKTALSAPYAYAQLSHEPVEAALSGGCMKISVRERQHMKSFVSDRRYIKMTLVRIDCLLCGLHLVDTE